MVRAFPSVSISIRYHQLPTDPSSYFMNVKLVNFISGLAGALTISYSEISYSQDDLWNLSLGELSEIRVSSIANGSLMPTDKSAAVTYVITNDDITATGATTLTQAMQSVPGLYIGRSLQALTPLFQFRGITSDYNRETLVMFNGIPLSLIASGNRGHALRDWPTALIKRIEIIRGPGSALYGADAFAGVINIVTYSAAENTANRVEINDGSFSTRSGSLLYRNNFFGWKYLFSIDAGKTNGYDAIIPEDQQTQFDKIYATHASLAPGNINAGYRWTENRIELEKESWKFRLGYEGRRDVEVGMGIGGALDPHGLGAGNYYNFDLTNTRSDFAPHLDIISLISFQTATQESVRENWVYPPGAFGGAFPNGFIGNPEFWERQWRGEITARYTGLEHHRLLTGIGGFKGDIYRVKESKNFNPDLSPLPSVIEITDPSLRWLPEKQRYNRFAMIQDEWQFNKNWQLVTGLRFDDYSDFGTTLNPRISLIWETTNTFTSRLIYGRSFRAPSIQELFVTSNPVLTGNSNLKPEIINNYELAFAYNPTYKQHIGFNLFHYEIDDYIVQVPVDANRAVESNSGARKGNGFEIELDQRFLDTVRFVSNVSVQRAQDDISHAAVGNAPSQQFYFRTEWSPVPNWLITPELNWWGTQQREFGDVRPPVNAATLANLTIIYSGFSKNLKLSASFRNIADKAYATPLPLANAAIVTDTPEPRRSLIGNVSYKF